MISISYLFYGLTSTFLVILRSVETVNICLKIYIISFIVNIIFNYIFIFGKFSMPVLGVTGAAVGTLIARMVEFIIILVYMLKFEKKINYKIHMLKFKDKNLLKDDIFEIKEEANGVFININKDLDKVNIHDKYKVRDILNSILIKGYSEHDLVHFMQFLGRVPVYIDEIILVESLEEKIRQDIYNKYFVITKNQEIEDLKLDSEKFRLHKFNCA